MRLHVAARSVTDMSPSGLRPITTALLASRAPCALAILVALLFALTGTAHASVDRSGVSGARAADARTMKLWRKADGWYRWLTVNWHGWVTTAVRDTEDECAQAEAYEAAGDQQLAEEVWNVVAIGAQSIKSVLQTQAVPNLEKGDKAIAALIRALTKRSEPGSPQRADLVRAAAQARAGLRLWGQGYNKVYDATASWAARDCKGARDHLDAANRLLIPGFKRVARSLVALKELAQAAI